MRTLFLDVLWGWRVVRAGRIESLFAIVGLAMALALSTAVFTILDVLIFRGPAVSSVDTLVRVRRESGLGSSNDWPIAEYREALSLGRRIMVEGWTDGGALLDVQGSKTEVPVSLVSGSFFSTLGVPAAAGRLLTRDDDRVDSMPVVVLSHAFWIRQFGGDASIVGTQVNVGKIQARVVGIAAQGFTGLDDPTDIAPPALWTPLSVAVHTDRLLGFGNSASSVKVVGRLSPTAAPSEAQAELSALAAGWAEQAGVRDAPRVHLERVAGAWLRSSTGAAEVILIVLGLVVLLAAINVSNLLLASVIARRSELSVRSALGASTARISRQLVVQGVVVGGLAGIAGFPLAYWTAPLLAQTIHTPQFVAVLPGIGTVIFASAAALVAGLGIGVLLAIFRPRIESLAGTVRGVPAVRRSRWTTGFIGLQAGISTAFLILAMLFGRADRRVAGIEYGFDIDRVVEVGPMSDRAAAAAQPLWTEQLRRVDGAPGVQMTAWARNSPLMARSHGDVYQLAVSVNYFDVMGLAVHQGRSFAEADSTQPVVLITERVARRYWPNQTPVGDSLRRVLPRASGMTVIGVVSDSVTNRIGWPDSGVIYRPLGSPKAGDYGLIRFKAPVTAESLRMLASLLGTSAISKEIRLWPLARYRTLEIDRVQRMRGVVTVLGIATLSLAILGLASIASFGLRQRAREIALRLAIGASPTALRSMLVRDTLKPTSIGIMSGILLAGVIGSLLRNFLAGISPWDPWSGAAAISVFLLAATVTAWLPARRVMRFDPARTLRE